MLHHSLLFLAQTPAGPSPQGGQSMLPTMIVYILFFIVVFYFMIMRPQKMRQQQQETLVKALQKGDKVVIGGIHGRIASVKDSTVMVSIAENVKIEVDKASVTTVLKRENEPAPAATTAT